MPQPVQLLSNEPIPELGIIGMNVEHHGHQLGI